MEDYSPEKYPVLEGMTIGQMKTFLNDYPDDATLMIHNHDEIFNNIYCVQLGPYKEKLVLELGIEKLEAKV